MKTPTHDEKLVEWKKKVWLLHILECKTDEYFSKNKINKREYETLKKVIDSTWLRIFDCYPDSNPQLTEAFHKNFDSQASARLQEASL